MKKSLIFRVCALAWASLLLAGCGSHAVGNGNGPAYLEIVPTGGAAGAAQARIFQCLLSSLSARIYFTDGESAVYTDRVVWTSSNNEVVKISSEEAPLVSNTGTAYAAGTMIPVGPGVSIITADYEGLESTIQVTVAEPTSFSMKQYLEQTYTPVTSALIGVGTSALYSVSIVVDGIEENASNTASWTVDGPNENVATVSGGGTSVTVTANGVTTSSTYLTAHFPSCGNTVSIPLTTKFISSLTSSLEFGSDPLMVTNAERVYVYAQFEDGTQQDISNQVTYPLVDNTVVTNTTGSNFISAVASGSVSIQPTMVINGTQIYAPYVNVSVASGELIGFTISQDVTSIIGNSDQVAQFSAVGTFSNGQTQDATRIINWTSSNTALAVISNDTDTAGQATTGSGDGQVTITASATNKGPAPDRSLTLDLVAP